MYSLQKIDYEPTNFYILATFKKQTSLKSLLREACFYVFVNCFEKMVVVQQLPLLYEALIFIAIKKT